MDWGAGLSLVLTTAFFGWLILAYSRNSVVAPSNVADDREDQPYTVFTTAFDIVARGREVSRILAIQPHSNYSPNGTKISRVNHRISAAIDTYDQSKSGELEKLRACATVLAEQTAIILLIDQSGSMCNKIVPIAGQVLLLAEELERAGVRTAILGFTTASWKGGNSRLAWLKSGRPEYPGRLCDLLHVVYKDFDRPMEKIDWEAMLDARALRENVDGEAIIWASQMLAERPEPDKRLIVVSDGAPVDDSTIAENGELYLPRHLREVVSQLECKGSTRPALIDLDNHAPSRFSTRIALESERGLVSGFLQLLETQNEAGYSTSRS